MQKTHKDQLRALVNTLRLTLAGSAVSSSGRGDLDGELERLGFAPDGTITALDALPNPTPADLRAYRAAEAQLGRLSTAERIEARRELVERAAYSWINRLLALRALEARGLISETLRANPDYEGIPESLFILRATEPARTSGADSGWWAVVEDACHAQAQILPGLFDLDDPNALLRPSVNALRTSVQALGTPRLDVVLADPDAIGWAYQFYQEEAKAQVYAKLGSGGKVETRREIAAATQLFTEPYMVAWLLQNSLGRSYAETYPTTHLAATWEYYIDPAKVNADQPAAELSPRPRFTLDELTVLDPCMGSGHFLRAAFDLLFAMHQEQHPDWTARTIANRILERHLYGIDIDPRAAQLAALTLVLRAWEWVQSAEGTAVTYTPPRLNLATTPKLPAGALDRHLERYADDAIYRPVLAKLFEALEQAPLLGSLLRPEEHLDAAIDALMTPNKRWQPALLNEDTTQQAALIGIQSEERSALKARLLERLGASFVKEAAEADVSAQLLGRAASEGVHLVQLLSHKYAVAVTNPPYMNSKHMDVTVKKYVEKNYKSGKRDLYGAFILRCLELVYHRGRVAMVTQQSWMFLKSFADLRAVPEDRLARVKADTDFAGLLRETCIETLAHLGANSFEEISGEIVQTLIFVASKTLPNNISRMAGARLTGISSPLDKAQYLKVSRDWKFVLQHRFLEIDGSPIVFWLGERLLDLLKTDSKLVSFAAVKMGLSTSENPRFLRFTWETMSINKWQYFAKGGGYCKWAGMEETVADWEHDGAKMKTFIMENYPGNHWSKNIRNPDLYFSVGATYSMLARGSLGVRLLRAGLFEAGSNSFFGDFARPGMAILNCRLASYLLKTTYQGLNFPPGYVSNFPIPLGVQRQSVLLGQVSDICTKYKEAIVSGRITEYCFMEILQIHEQVTISALLHSVESYNEAKIFDAYSVNDLEKSVIVDEIGTPAGWHPLLTGYDTIPPLPADLDLPPLPQAVLDHLAQHERIQLSAGELARIKAHLRALYEAGPGAKLDDSDDTSESSDGEGGDEEAAVAGAYIPIPTETFLEELSVKLQIHPISVYWLLEELRGEGVRCLPEERRLLEDRLAVIVLRLLGHRWPKQIEAGEPVPDWADRDGVIPLTPGAGEATLAERVRSRLRAEEGDLGAQHVEALLQELTGGRDLAEWLRRDFFTRHQRQFKKRPIAWHLRSTPQGRGKRSSAPPAFECMVYYHATDSDILARIRTRYVEPLILAERSRQSQARQSALPGMPANARETVEAEASQRINELEDFANRLRHVEEQGFACADLERLIAAEPLDRWSGDGYTAPASTADLLAQEAAWRVDINDGVRVNIVPLQAAGLLATDLLAKKDLPKAVADRARWRADERRWVRGGKLPRCGWMDARVPESPTWTAQAPQREAERQRLEEKRKKVLAELQG